MHKKGFVKPSSVFCLSHHLPPHNRGGATYELVLVNVCKRLLSNCSVTRPLVQFGPAVQCQANWSQSFVPPLRYHKQAGIRPQHGKNHHHLVIIITELSSRSLQTFLENTCTRISRTEINASTLNYEHAPSRFIILITGHGHRQSLARMAGLTTSFMCSALPF